MNRFSSDDFSKTMTFNEDDPNRQEYERHHDELSDEGLDKNEASFAFTNQLSLNDFEDNIKNMLQEDLMKIKDEYEGLFKKCQSEIENDKEETSKGFKELNEGLRNLGANIEELKGNFDEFLKHPPQIPTKQEEKPQNEEINTTIEKKTFDDFMSRLEPLEKSLAFLQKKSQKVAKSPTRIQKVRL